MLKISLFELFVAVIPEAFIFVFGVYILSRKEFCYKRIVISGIAIGFATYFIRLLPIFPGVNIIFITLASTTLLVFINQIYVIKAISSFLTLLLIRLVTEWLNMVLLINVLKQNLDTIADDPIRKTQFFLPALILFGGIVYVLYCIRKKKNKVVTDVSA